MATQTSNLEIRSGLTESAPRIPDTMRAAVYRGINDMRVETVSVPKIGPGELLVKVATCGVCGTDLKKIHTGSHSAPRIFGHEMSGTVVATGAGVTRYEVGDRVVVHHHVPCGNCYYCRKQTPTQCELYKRVGVTAGFEPSGGGFAEYIRVMHWIVEGRGVVRIPDGVPFEQAAFVLMHAALARRSGAKVLTSDLYPERHALAARFGLEHPIHAGREDVVEKVFEWTDGRGADAVVLAVGGNALIQTAMDAARPGGRVMLFAQTQHGEATIDPGAVCMDEKTLMGSYSSSFEILDEVTDLVFGGYRKGFDLTQLISHRFPLEQAVNAIEVASHPMADSMKIMLEPAPGMGAGSGTGAE
jgi:L-iditol 2-dehydrogenase